MESTENVNATERGQADEERWSRPAERRRNARYLLKAAATVSEAPAPAGPGRKTVRGLYWIKNISASGALLEGRTSHEAGTRLNLVLHLPWQRPVALDAAVVHQRSAAGSAGDIGILFEHRGAATRSAIEAAVASAERCRCWQRKPAVLLIARRQDDFHELEQELAGLGLPCHRAETPLDALRVLQDWETQIDTIIVDPWLDQTDVFQLIRFLVGEFKDVRRTVFADSGKRRLTQVVLRDGWLHPVVEGPWSRQGIASMVGATLS